VQVKAFKVWEVEQLRINLFQVVVRKVQRLESIWEVHDIIQDTGESSQRPNVIIIQKELVSVNNNSLLSLVL
jgi:hypothetical protein